MHSLYSKSKSTDLHSSASTIDVGPGQSYPMEEVIRDVTWRPKTAGNDKSAVWVSPVDVNQKEWFRPRERRMRQQQQHRHHRRQSFAGEETEIEDPFNKCPDSSFDLGSSPVVLDFGLISPRKYWYSPPQRIERAQNREWSPHRVIDRPNPENSPGNWISVKESCQQSPSTRDSRPIPSERLPLRLPAEEPRSCSQTTYVLPERIQACAPAFVEPRQPKRKTCVLGDYVPDRGGGGDVAQAKMRPPPDSGTTNYHGVSDKVKRIVEPSGRVVKISHLEDYQVPAFGKGGGGERNPDDLDKSNVHGELSTKTIKSNLNLTGRKEKSLKLKTTLKPAIVAERGNADVKLRAEEKEEDKGVEDGENKKVEVEEKEKDDVAGNTKKMISDIECILRGNPPSSPVREKEKSRKKEKTEKKKSLGGKSQGTEEKAPIVPEKKRRNIDVKEVQEFIKNQKQKRVEMMKANKKTKVEEREAIKKKLEELRVRTLKLAAQSKKKKPAQNTIKIIEAGTEDDVTMSLGLKQVKPKVSYNESVSNLKKKTPRMNFSPPQPTDHEDQRDETDGFLVEEDHDKVEGNGEREKNFSNLAESKRKPETPERISDPPADLAFSLDVKKRDELKETLKKLAEALHLRIANEKNQLLRSAAVSPKSKSSMDSIKGTSEKFSGNSIKGTSEKSAKGNRQMIKIDARTIHALKEDIRKISENFKVLHEIIVEKTDVSSGKKPEKKSREEDFGKCGKAEKCFPRENRSLRPATATGRNEKIPVWLRETLPKPPPYSVYTAFRRKMNLDTTGSSVSLTSRESSSYAETVSNKHESDFEDLSVPPDRLLTAAEKGKVERIIGRQSLGKTSYDAAEENQFTVKDSGSELSSSILDSDKQILANIGDNQQVLSLHSSSSLRLREKRKTSNSGGSSSESSSRSNSTDSLTASSVVTEVTSKNLRSISDKVSSVSTRLSLSSLNFQDERENLILVTPDVKLIANDLVGKKLNNCEKNLNYLPAETGSVAKENHPLDNFREKDGEMNNAGEKFSRDPKSDSTITEIIDNLSENDKSQALVKANNKKFQNVMRRLDENQTTRRSFFQPEMLHLQFQAELTLLETFQQSLSHFLEAERMKTLSEVTKIVYEKSVNTEKSATATAEREDQGVQTSFFLPDGESNRSRKENIEKAETDSVITDLAKSEKESVKTDVVTSEEESVKSVKTVSTAKDDGNKEEEEEEEEKEEKISEKISDFNEETFEEDTEDSNGTRTSRNEVKSERKEYLLETPDEDLSASGHNGISFQMLNRMIKDEELRSEHQLALIRLREKTLNEKVKAELTFLEMKKRALKEGGTEEEHSVSAIKKRQRGILIKYQSEKEEIERLKKMHKIASEERKIMMRQQKQIQQMQLSTKDMLIKLRRRDKSPLKRIPLKPKVSMMNYDSQSDIPEDIVVQMSDSILTESVCSLENSSRRSRESDFEISSGYSASECESDAKARKGKKVTEEKINLERPTFKSKKSSAMEPEKYPKKRDSVDELSNWTKRLEEKENRLKELEKSTGTTSMSAAKIKPLPKSLKTVKISMKDRSTSPFQFPGENMPGRTVENSSSINEEIDAKNSSTISEAVPASSIYKMEATENTEKKPSTVTEDIATQFSKNNSRTLEYYSESFESPSSSEVPKAKTAPQQSKTLNVSEGSYRSMPIKLSLSPRIQSPRRRNSSGSDDSQNLSHTETASEQSDLESRIAALHEQLRKRKLEAERLRREQRKAQRERLRVKEQSLLKQIQAYDAYIQKKKQELEQEYEHSAHAVSKPLIKQPKVAEKSNFKRQEPLMLSETDKIRFYPKAAAGAAKAAKDKEEAQAPQQKIVAESDSEILEHIKEASERTSASSEEKSSSVPEQIESRTEELEGEREVEEEEIEEAVEMRSEKIVESTSVKEAIWTAEAETSSNDPSEELTRWGSAAMTTESVPEPEIELEGSLSESEDQSASIKTTVQSQGKQDKTEIFESKTDEAKVTREKSKVDNSSSENLYLSDSFESDFDEKTSTKGAKEKEASSPSRDSSEVPTDISKEPSVVSGRSEIYESSKAETKEEARAEHAADEIEEEEDEEEEEAEENGREPEDKEKLSLSVESGKSEPDEPETTSVSTEEPISSDISAKMANAEIISDSIILDLLSESVKMFSARESKIQKKSKEEMKTNREILASVLAKGIIAETIEEMIAIYNRRAEYAEERGGVGGEDKAAGADEEPVSPERITSDIRKRICEIMSQAGGIKDQRRPQSAMITTYDVIAHTGSPTDEGDKSDHSGEREKFIRSSTPPPKSVEDKTAEVFPRPETARSENKADGFSQEWFDDDFGLSRTRREAEQLRLQQLQIEQEIQQLQAQQDRIPYYYLREIPNKPPPPYTPPGKPLSEIPTSEDDVISVTTSAVEMIAGEMAKGKSPGEVEPSREFFGSSASSEHVKCYKTFLFDLAKYLIDEVVRIQDRKKEEVLPWLRVREPLSVYRYEGIERTAEGLNAHVRKRVLGLFGFGRKIGRDSLMMRCFKKKRDHVDEILVCESQEEEARWTQYDEDQVAVKNEVALAILDDLLLDSTRSLRIIFDKKAKRSK